MVGAPHTGRQILGLLRSQIANEGQSKLVNRSKNVDGIQRTSRVGKERMPRTCSGSDEKKHTADGERRRNLQEDTKDTQVIRRKDKCKTRPGKDSAVQGKGDAR